jgi:hypothetical protein
METRVTYINALWNQYLALHHSRAIALNSTRWRVVTTGLTRTGEPAAARDRDDPIAGEPFREHTKMSI